MHYHKHGLVYKVLYFLSLQTNDPLDGKQQELVSTLEFIHIEEVIVSADTNKIALLFLDDAFPTSGRIA